MASLKSIRTSLTNITRSVSRGAKSEKLMLGATLKNVKVSLLNINGTPDLVGELKTSVLRKSWRENELI